MRRLLMPAVLRAVASANLIAAAPAPPARAAAARATTGALAPPRPPDDRAAAERTITGLLAQHRVPDALDAYDRYVAAASHVPDTALLATIGRAQLAQLATDADAGIAAEARQRLAAAGDTAALAALRTS